MDKFNLPLTDDEREELKERPVGSDKLHAFTNKDIIKLRKSIGMKLEKYLNELDQTLTEEHKKIYEVFPRHGFYTDKEDSIKRIIGIYTKDGKVSLLAVSCMITQKNTTPEIVPMDSVEEIEYWSDEQINKISHSPTYSYYIDPLGWLCFINK